MTQRELVFSIQTWFSRYCLAVAPPTGKGLMSLLPWSIFVIAAGVLYYMPTADDVPVRTTQHHEVFSHETGKDVAHQLPLFINEGKQDDTRFSMSKWLTSKWHSDDVALLDAPPTRLGITLTGTLTGSEDRTLAIVAQNDYQQSVRPGDVLRNIPAKVIRIAEDRIVIEISGEYATVHLASVRTQGKNTK